MTVRTPWVAVSLSIAACSVGPRYTRPAMSTPTAWSELPASQAATTDRAALARWWTTFRDPTLDALVSRTVEGNLDLKIAAARVKEARAARGIAASRALPQLDAAASYSRAQRSNAVPPFNSGSGGGGPSPFGARVQNTFEAGFDAAWELDVFGGVRRDEEAAAAEVEAAAAVLPSLWTETAASLVFRRT